MTTEIGDVPEELQVILMGYLSPQEILNYCSTDIHNNKFCNDNRFWRSITWIKFPSIARYLTEDISWYSLFYSLGKYFYNPNAGLENAIQKRNLNLVKYYVEERKANNYLRGLLLATFWGYKEIVEYLAAINDKSSYNLGMFVAAYQGNTDLVNYFTELGANDWDYGFFGLHLGKIPHPKLYQFFTAKGANYSLYYQEMRGLLLMSEIDISRKNYSPKI